jgi:ParB family chromosome partitioning protein
VSEKRRGLGRGLGALIPSTTSTKPAGDRPVDVFFPGRTETQIMAPEARNGSTDDPVVLHGRAPVPAADPTALPSGDPHGSAPDAGSSGTGTGRPADSTPPDGTASGSAPSSIAPATSVGSNGTAAAVSPTELLPVPGAYFAELPVTAIRPNPRQPRQVFDEEALAELVHSVKEIGVLQPVVVRRSDDEDGEARYELIMGERRWRATQEAGLDRIPAIVRETSDDTLLRDALLENLHRSQLNPLEEAAAYQQLLDDFGCTHEELASRIGRSRPQISNTIRLLRLPPLVQRRVAAGVLSAGHARALLGLDDSSGMERLAQRIVSEGLSVRAVEEVVALGDGPAAKPVKKRPRAGSHTSELDDLASRLGDRLDTRVSVALGRSRGRLSIDFASVEDLNRIVGLMAPEVKGVFQEVR